MKVNKRVMTVIETAPRVVFTLRKRHKLPLWMNDDEALSAAYFGLIMADQSFDGKSGVPFRAWAYQKAYWSVLDEIRRMTKLREREVSLEGRLEELYDRIEWERDKEEREELAVAPYSYDFVRNWRMPAKAGTRVPRGRRCGGDRGKRQARRASR